MARAIRLWGYPAVRDRNGHPVHVELDRVRDDVGQQRPTRWRLIPLIIPTIKRGQRTERAQVSPQASACRSAWV
jgi:hypothetical protein